MSIYYRLYSQTDNLHPEESRNRGLFPRIIRKRTVELKELCNRASQGTTFGAFELEIAELMLSLEIINSTQSMHPMELWSHISVIK
jgi:hypothetical protein